MVNLEKFYTVQQYSGVLVEIFSTAEAAEHTRSKWISELEARFKQSDWSVMQSTLDSDLHGGCVQALSIAEHLWPGPIDEILPWEAKHSAYRDCRGASTVEWGSPVFQRPRK